ncbi:MAG: hypothetical protein ACTSVY_16290 [Candidatus Helarchaeota archaeon]
MHEIIIYFNCKAIKIVSLGGIIKSNAKEIIKASCKGVVVIIIIMLASDPKIPASELIEKINKD